MNEVVDVLAVLDRATVRESDAGQSTVSQIAARAAVDELIDSTRALCKEIGFRIDDPRCALRDRVVRALAVVGA
jgi:hypothetical protein